MRNVKKKERARLEKEYRSIEKDIRNLVKKYGEEKCIWALNRFTKYERETRKRKREITRLESELAEMKR